MNLRIERQWLTDVSTCGQLYIDDARFCYTLEEPSKDGKAGSCILPGKYWCMVTHSPEFGRDMPLVMGPHGRTAIRIHWGNTAKDTQGCILLGYSHQPDFIGQSRDAFGDFWAKAEGAMRAGNCQLEITAPQPPAVLDASDL